MKPVTISKALSSNEAMSCDRQDKPRKAQNKRRQHQRQRRKRNQKLLYEQPTYPICSNQNYFLHKYQNLTHSTVKPITVVAGSSMAARLIEDNLQTSNDLVKLTYESGCNCSKMLEWLTSVDGRQFMHNARRLILILGTNDLHVVPAEETIHRIRQTVETIRLLFPRIAIVWQLLQWRMKATRYLSSGVTVLHEIDKCNILLLELSHRLNFQIIDPALTRHNIDNDDLHPTDSGSRLMERCIRFFLEQQYRI